MMIAMPALFAAGLLCLIPGCSQPSPIQKVDDEFETVSFKKAKEKFELRDYTGAISLYEEVLRDNPNMAKSHFELGLIYDDKLGDYVSAIYHYRRYLKLRPSGSKAKVVEQWIPRAELAFASMQPNSPIQSADELARLQKENLKIRADMEELQRNLASSQNDVALARQQMTALQAQLEAAQAAAQNAAANAGTQPGAIPADGALPATPAAGQPNPTHGAPAVTAAPGRPSDQRIHTVKGGETLWKISASYYPGQVPEGIQKILEANKDTLPNAAKLKIGQTLIIP
jgi:tetratricopeptide (TPR) repeat protein